MPPDPNDQDDIKYANETDRSQATSNRTHVPGFVLRLVGNGANVEEDAPRVEGKVGVGRRRPVKKGRRGTTARLHSTARYAPGVEFIGDRRIEVLVVHDALQFLSIRNPPIRMTREHGRVQTGNKRKHTVIRDEQAVFIEVARVGSAVPIVVVLLHPHEACVIVRNGPIAVIYICECRAGLYVTVMPSSVTVNWITRGIPAASLTRRWEGLRRRFANGQIYGALAKVCVAL